MLKHKKIIEPAQIIKEIAKLRASNLSIVFTNGCYDILHPGHVNFLQQAKSLGDILILALNSDASVKRLGKNPPRPINDLISRAYTIAHLNSVDIVTSFEQDTPLELINQIKPDVLVKGGDWALDKIVGRDFVESYGGKVISIPLLNGFSTTAILERILYTHTTTHLNKN